MEFDESVLRAFIEDSREQLGGITDDLLGIEAAGADADAELVNRAFRAVHSIKGGAGFLDLDAIASLAHGMEGVLNRVRNHDLVLDGDATSVLLRATDALLEMLDAPATSNERDLSAHLAALQAIVEGTEPPPIAPRAPQPGVEPAAPDAGAPLAADAGPVHLSTTPERAAQALQALDYLYVVEYRREADLDGRGRTADDLLADLALSGEVLEHVWKGDALFVLLATAAEPGIAGALLELDDERIRPLLPADLEPAVAVHPVALHAAPVSAAPVPAVLAGEDGPAQAQRQRGTVGLSPEALLALGPPGDGDLLPGVAAEAAQDDAALETAPPSRRKHAPEGTAATSRSASGASAADSSLRVHVSQLDRLMNLAGELVLTRNQLVQVVGASDLQAVTTTTQHLDQVTTQLQEAVVSTRMQPIGNVFGRFRRIVRDLSRDLGKEVDLVIEGEEVDLDKGIIEALADPLTHLVRNALDHGIEPPARRRELDKPVPATLRLSAFHQAGQVIIEVSDDGRGIDVQKVRQKALSSGRFDATRVGAMGERELLKLVFEPGFSTAESVTAISGRGVGMDVVHTNLTKLGGVVDLDTQVNVGTVLRIKLPLTLAIIPSLLAVVASECFAVPQVSLAELVRVPASQRAQRVHSLGDAQVLHLRGSLLPLVSLRHVLGLEERASQDGALFIMVLKARNFQYGLLVDELLDSREIVVKPLDQYLSGCRIYAGATILGDGRVALILDVVGLAETLGLAPEEDGADQAPSEAPAAAGDTYMLLLVRNAEHEQFGLPAGLVSRVERIRHDQIEHVGGITSMQYRGGHLRLLSLEDAARVAPRTQTDSPYVVVFSVAGHEIGLLVSGVVDIVAQPVAVETQGFAQPGIIGSSVVDGKTTLVVDLYGLVRAVDPAWVESQEQALRGEATILVAEDNAFFRDQFRRLLGNAGYRTIIVEDGTAALEVLERQVQEIDLLVTDIEMPRLDGLGLTRQVRADARFAHLPVIAVTSLSGDKDEQRGRAVGIDEYLIKMDAEMILSTVQRHLRTRRGAP